MSQIILELLEDDAIIFIVPSDLDRVLKNDQGILTGKTLREHIEEDILNNTDKTGWCKYRETLKQENIALVGDMSKWDIKPALPTVKDVQNALED